MYNYGGAYGYPQYGDSGANFSFDYWVEGLYQRLTALISIKGAPEGSAGQYGWDIDALKYGLFYRGYMAVFRSATYGVVPQPCGLSGYGLQFQPTGAVVNTPYFQFERPLKIGYECELLKLTPNYNGVLGILTKYAAELKEIDVSIKAAAKNSRLAYALIADSDKSARALKGIREKIINGDDVIIDEKLIRNKGADVKQLPWYEFDRDLKNSYILGDLLEARRTTLVDFYREIGVRMTEDKKERMITSEVNAGEAETFIRSEVWAETLKDSVKKINNMFGTSLKIEINKPDFTSERTEGDSYAD